MSVTTATVNGPSATLFVASAFGLSAIACELAQHLPSIKTQLNARQRRAWHTAVQYHFTHAGALAVAAYTIITLTQQKRQLGPDADPAVVDNLTRALYHIRTGFWFVCVGAGGFATSIYTLCLGAPRWVGPVTPSSGLVLVWGWISLGLGGMYLREKSA